MIEPGFSPTTAVRRRAGVPTLPVAILAAALLAAPRVAAEQAASKSAAKATVMFDGVAMVQAAEGDTPGEHWREFIPAGEDLKSWTRLASIREYPKLDDPKTVAGNLVRALRRQNPQAGSAILENKKTGEIIVDFITWPDDHKFVEFNLFRYGRHPNGGVIVQQYALRRYENTSGFLAAFKSERQRLVNMMATRGLSVQ